MRLWHLIPVDLQAKPGRPPSTRDRSWCGRKRNSRRVSWPARTSRRRPANRNNHRTAVDASPRWCAPSRSRPTRATRHRRPRGPRAALTAAPFWLSGASLGRPSAREPHFRCWARCLFISNMVTFFLPNTFSSLAVGQDLAPVRRVLQVVLLDVLPDLAHHLAARQGPGPDHRRQLLGRLQRLLQPVGLAAAGVFFDPVGPLLALVGMVVLPATWSRLAGG